MKKISLLVLPLLLSVCACSKGGDKPVNKKTVEKTGAAYLLPTKSDTVPLLSDLKLGTKNINYRIVENQPLVPYFTVQEYAGVYANMYNDLAKNSFTTEGDTFTWVLNVNNVANFAAEFNYKTQEVRANGMFTLAYKSQGSSISPDILKYIQITTKVMNEKEMYSAKTTSYKGFDLDPVKVDNDYYFPLCVLDHLFSDYTGYSIYFAYNEFYVASSSDYNSLTVPFKESKDAKDTSHALLRARNNAIEVIKETFVAEEIDESGKTIKTTFPVMPLYLREYHRNSFYFVFETLYGLKYVRRITSMKEYFANDEHADDLLSDDPLVRGEAMNYLIGNLADGHTSIRTNNSFVWHEVIKERYRGKLWDERIKLRSDLLEKREEAYIKYDIEHKNTKEVSIKPEEYAVRYSDDEELAFFNFDSFEVSMSPFNKDGFLKEDVYKEDTFYYLARQFEDIKNNHKKVKDVVIDLSTNGGGIVIALMKISALISKDNSADIDQYTQGLNRQDRYTIKVDTNRDGKYDQDDVYGDDFNIHLLCSSFSFSCGNAYPFIAYKEGLANIIGTRSGGGECAVDTTMLASGQYIGHSSLTRIGYFNEVKDEKGDITGYEFEGGEAGAPVSKEYTINYDYYYDFNYLENKIKANAY